MIPVPASSKAPKVADRKPHLEATALNIQFTSAQKSARTLHGAKTAGIAITGGGLTAAAALVFGPLAAGAAIVALARTIHVITNSVKIGA